MTLAGKPVCLNCDHWAKLSGTLLGLCVEPESPMFHQQPRYMKQSLHVSYRESCTEYLEIPEARGLDRRRPQQNETSNG